MCTSKCHASRNQETLHHYTWSLHYIWVTRYPKHSHRTFRKPPQIFPEGHQEILWNSPFRVPGCTGARRWTWHGGGPCPVPRSTLSWAPPVSIRVPYRCDVIRSRPCPGIHWLWRSRSRVTPATVYEGRTLLKVNVEYMLLTIRCTLLAKLLTHAVTSTCYIHLVTVKGTYVRCQTWLQS